MMLPAEIGQVPKVVIAVWLKSLGLTHSPDAFEKLQAHFESRTLSDAQVKSFINDYKNYGSKHVYWFLLQDADWVALTDTEALKKRTEDFFATLAASPIPFGMTLEKNEASKDLFQMRLVRSIRVPKVDRENIVTRDGRDWAPVVYENIPVNVVIEVRVAQREIQLRFDAVNRMGTEKKKILDEAKRFIKDTLGLANLSSLSLTALGPKLERSSKAQMIDVIAKVDTEGESGDRVAGTVRFSRDNNSPGNAADLPGGKDVLVSGNNDILFDTYEAVWLESESGGVLERNITTKIYSLVGDVHFRQHVLKAEMEYVLSSIRELSK